MSGRTYDLEDRLIEFSSRIIDVVDALPSTRAGNYLANQLIRSGVAPSLVYGEAQAAESREDFIHKMKIILKELKETRVSLKLIRKREMIRPETRLISISGESDQLIAIVAKSIETARKNIKKLGKGMPRPEDTEH
jgi:four helix bundle protein